jgi:hypothetical protein
VGDDRGAVAVLVAASMILLLGFAALAIDIGAGYSERRADQTAADTGVMSGAVYVPNGVSAMRTNLLNIAEQNLPNNYSAAEWQSIWENCVDPAADRNFGGYVFQPIPAPSGWAPVDSNNWCISVASAGGLIRVRLPDQLIDTSFGRIVGVNQLSTGAFAVAKVNFGSGAGGILPFGLPSGANGHVCLSSGPTGLAIDPCTGAASGNFGTLKGPKFGNPDIPTAVNCGASPLNQVLAQNISHGYDHTVTVHPDDPTVSTANEIRDQCNPNPAPGYFAPFPNTLETDTGYPGLGLEVGLVGNNVGTVPGSPLPPRLAQGAGSTTTLFGRTANDVPLWSYLINNPSIYDNSSAPTICDPTTFDGAPGEWDGDTATVESNSSWQHMQACINAYNALPSPGVMFSSGIANNTARFVWIPMFWESSLGSGLSWRHVELFQPAYLQTTAWKQGTSWRFHHPGENDGAGNHCIDETGAFASCAGPLNMQQLSAFVLPLSSLPSSVTGTTPPGGPGPNPFVDPELFR